MFEEDGELDLENPMATGRAAVYNRDSALNSLLSTAAARPAIGVIVSNKAYLPFFITLALALMGGGVLANMPEIVLVGVACSLASISTIHFTERLPGNPSPRSALFITLSGMGLAGVAAYYWRGWGAPYTIYLSFPILGLALGLLLIPALRRLPAKAEVDEDKSFSAEEINSRIVGLMEACDLLVVRWKPKCQPQYMARNQHLESIRKALETLPPIVGMLSYLPMPMLKRMVKELSGLFDAMRRVLAQVSTCPDELADVVLQEVSRSLNSTLGVILVYASTSEKNLTDIEQDTVEILGENREIMCHINQELEQMALAKWNSEFGDVDKKAAVNTIEKMVSEWVDDTIDEKGHIVLKVKGENK